jgi:uncharacterized protein YciI
MKMISNKIQIWLLAMTCTLFGACASNVSSLQTVVLEGGPQWKAGEPPERQDLAGHFAYTKNLFAEGRLIANGPTMDDFRGFYVYKVRDRAELDQITRDDPALRSGVLKLVGIETWSVGIENMGANVGSEPLFVLHYLPGARWKAGTEITKQDGFSKTIEYVTKYSETGKVLAAGLVSEMKARVILAAASIEQARSFANADPGVQSGLIKIDVKPWVPFMRQGALKK